MKSKRGTEKFLVGYFSMIGFYLAFSLFVASFFGLGNVASPILVTILYSLLLYSFWRDEELIIKIALAALLSFMFGGIIFIFTFPIWIVFGPVCVVYGLVTGLFIKQPKFFQVENSNSTFTSQVLKTGQMNQHRLRPVVGIFSLFACLYIIYHISFYGFKLNTCAYTDELLPTPEELMNTSLLLENDIYLAEGKNEKRCSTLLKDATNELVDSNIIDNVTAGVDSFARRGQTIETFRRNKIFTVEKIIAQTKHGLSAIDSGSEPIYYVVLKDDRGEHYIVYTGYLGKEFDKINLTYVSDGSKYVLDWEYFESLYNTDWENYGEESVRYEASTNTPSTL